MKSLFVLVFVTLIITSSLNAQFYDRLNISASITSVSGQNVYCSTPTGLLASHDNSNSWSTLTTGNSTNYIFPINSDTVYFGNSSSIYKSCDGGKTFQTCSTATNIFACYFLTGSIGYLVGNSKILSTVDGGVTFQNAVVTAPYKSFRCVWFTDAKNGFAAGLGSFVKSTDGGANWYAGSTMGSIASNSIYFVDTLYGWSAGTSGNLVRTTDGGLTWSLNKIVPNSVQNLKSLKFYDRYNGIVCGDSSIFKTIDGGINWTETKLPAGKLASSAAFTSMNSGWLASSTFMGYDELNPHLNIIDNASSFNAGDSITINWSASLLTLATLSAHYSSDAGNSWNLIAESISSNELKYKTLAPVLNSNSFLFKIKTNTPPYLESISTFPNTVKLNFYMCGNEIKQFLYNDGISSYNKNGSGSAGLWWPGGESATKTMVFEDGFLFGGLVNGSPRIEGSAYRTGLRPGNILPDGKAANPSNARFNLWKLKKNWQQLPAGLEREMYQYSYNNWPGDLGAPYDDINKNGVYDKGIDEPKIFGDETIWFVANDLDSNQSKFLYGSLPIGIEMQVTEFAYNTPELKDVLFKKVKLINKGTNPVSSMFMTIWADPDIGEGFDDYAGCDTALNLAYVYNGGTTDYYYGENPPAIGYYVFQPPVLPASSNDSALYNWQYRKGYESSKMNSFAFFLGGSSTYRDPMQGDISGTYQLNLYMLGKCWDGSDWNDPTRPGVITKHLLYGDPVLGTGWYEGAGWTGGPSPSDHRILPSFGPFDFPVGGEQEMAFAICIAKGSSNIQSIAEMKKLCSTVNNFIVSNVTSVDGASEGSIPYKFNLHQNYPNPFNPTTLIQYELPIAGFVTLKVFNVLGKEVQTLINSYSSEGMHSVSMNVTSLSSGVYFYSLTSGNNSITKKMVVLK